MDVPTKKAIAKGVLRNKAIQAALAKPVPGLEHYCTPQAVADEQPVKVVYEYGYVICSIYDTELPSSELPGAGLPLRITPLDPDDEWHPERIRYVYLATLPRTNRLGVRPARTRAPRAALPTSPVAPPGSATDDDVSDLAAALGFT